MSYFFLGFLCGFFWNIWLCHKACFTRGCPARLELYFEGEETTHMNLKVNDQLPITLQASDEFGNKTDSVFDAPPAWSSSDDTVVAVAPSADGLSCTLSSPAGKLAGATVQVSGLVGGQAIQGQLQITTVPGDVAELVLVPGTPVAVAPAAPSA